MRPARALPEDMAVIHTDTGVEVPLPSPLDPVYARTVANGM
ncbi:MAG: hypothetical protein AVDCRST_MAG12-357, partial [uncultured Rubrobacteraceae bacterium]